MNPSNFCSRTLLSTLTFSVLAIALAVCPIALPTENPTDQLATCKSELQKWKDWAAVNVPKYEERGQERLTSRNEDFFLAALCAFGFGVGVYSMYLLGKFVKRIRPFSRARKQLCILLGAAGWVTLMVLANAGQVSRHPINALAAVLLSSLPVLLLAGIMFWWLKRGENLPSLN